MHARNPLSALALAAAPIALGGWQSCDGNEAGDLAAERFGDLSNPAAERADAQLEMIDACPDSPTPAAPAVTWLRRRPYLQRLTDRSVHVLWTTTPDTA